MNNHDEEKLVQNNVQKLDQRLHAGKTDVQHGLLQHGSVSKVDSLDESTVLFGCGRVSVHRVRYREEPFQVDVLAVDCGDQVEFDVEVGLGRPTERCDWLSGRSARLAIQVGDDSVGV